MVEGGLTEAACCWLLALDSPLWPQPEAPTHGSGCGAALTRTSGHWEHFTVNVSVLGGAQQQRDHFKCQAEATSS